MREGLKVYERERGLRVAVYDNGPTCGEFGVLYTPPYDCKVNSLRGCHNIWVVDCEDIS